MRNLFQKTNLMLLIYWRIFWLTIGYWFFGLEFVNESLLHSTIGIVHILQHFGATIGKGSIIHGPLIIHNADKNYANLFIGDNVHIGKNVFFDLSEVIRIGDNTVISMNCTLLTHQDVGKRPLRSLYPPQAKPLQIGRGTYLGANVNILMGAHVGDFCVIGAGAVLTRPLSSFSVAVGVPAKKIKNLPKET